MESIKIFPDLYCFGINKIIDENDQCIFGKNLGIIDLATAKKYHLYQWKSYKNHLNNFESVFGNAILKFLEDYHNVEFINILSRRLNGFNWFDIYVDGFKPSEEEKELTNYYDMYELALRFDPSNIRDEFIYIDNEIKNNIKDEKEIIKCIKDHIKFYICLDVSKVLDTCFIKFKDQDFVDLKRENYYPLWLTESKFSYRIFTISPVMEIINLKNNEICYRKGIFYELIKKYFKIN